MFIKIQFEKSNFNQCISKEDYLKFIEEKTIPEELRFNIFTKEQIDKLNSILDSNLKVEQINTYCLSKSQLYKDVPYVWSNSSEDEKRKAEEYEEKYNEAKFIDLYLVKDSSSVYIIDSDLLFSIIDGFNIKYKYNVIGIWSGV